jgi:hypothetical protein
MAWIPPLGTLLIQTPSAELDDVVGDPAGTLPGTDQ